MNRSVFFHNCSERNGGSGSVNSFKIKRFFADSQPWLKCVAIPNQFIRKRRKTPSFREGI